MKSRSLMGAALALLMLAGCAGNPTAENAVRVANQDLAKDFSPFRMQLAPNGTKGRVARDEWAGEPGASITAAAPAVREDILRALNANCGHRPEQLRETRVVKHAPPLFYEVWVFEDAQSQRRDQRSGLAVVMRQLPNGGGVDFSVRGPCHSPRQVEFYFN